MNGSPTLTVGFPTKDNPIPKLTEDLEINAQTYTYQKEFNWG